MRRIVVSKSLKRNEVAEKNRIKVDKSKSRKSQKEERRKLEKQKDIFVSMETLEGKEKPVEDLALLGSLVQAEDPGCVLVDIDFKDSIKEEIQKRHPGLRIGYAKIEGKTEVIEDSINWVESEVRSKKLFFCFENNGALRIIHAKCGHKIAFTGSALKDTLFFFCPLHPKETFVKLKKKKYSKLLSRLKQIPIDEELKIGTEEEVYFRENTIRVDIFRNNELDVIFRKIRTKSC